VCGSQPPVHSWTLNSTLIQSKSKSKSHCDWRSVSQSVSLGVQPHLGLMTRYLLLFNSYGPCFVGRPLWREDGSVFCICCWPLLAQPFLVPSPLVLTTIFYCLRFETSFSSPSTTRRVTVEVFDTASTFVRLVSEQSRAKQSSSLLPVTSQHGYSWHRAPLGPMAIYVFVQCQNFCFLSSSVVPPLITREELDFIL
jgi:hypothetical protein